MKFSRGTYTKGIFADITSLSQDLGLLSFCSFLLPPVRNLLNPFRIVDRSVSPC